MAKLVRILVADDHAVVRAGLRALLERQSNLRIVAEAATGEEAIAQARDYRPDIAILDIRMPGISGIEACRQILELVEDCRVIMLTAYAEDELLFASLRVGASGYVLKRMGDNDLIHAVERVSQGENMLDPGMTETVFAQLRESSHAQEKLAFKALTERELAVLMLVCNGLTNREIALKLYLGEGTIRNYVSKVLGKIGVSSRAGAAAYAVKHHIDRLTPLSGI